MGSGTTRKRNDSVIINRPKTKKGSGANGGGQDQTQYEDMNTICPPTIKIRLNSQKLLPEGARLILENENILFSGQKVGLLTKSQFTTVTQCITEGFRYPGEVVSKGEHQYGLFTRK